MCWSEEVLWISFILGTILNVSLIYYFKEPDIRIVLLLWEWILLIQLFEALAWRSQPTT